MSVRRLVREPHFDDAVMRGVRRSFADHPVENEAAQTLQSEQKRRAFLLPMGEDGVRRHSGRAPEEFCAFEQTAIGRGGGRPLGDIGGARKSTRLNSSN